MRYLLVILCCCGWLAAPLWAEDVSVEATVDSNHLSMGEAGQLTLTVHGVKDGIEPPQWPKMDGLEANYTGPSTSISIINGQYSSTHAYNYSLFPTKTGAVQIPPLPLTIDGKLYTTGAIDIDIGDAARPGAAASSAAAAPSPAQQVSIKDKIFMLVTTPQATVYVGQKVPLRVKLYINGLPLRNLQYPKFDIDGFTMDGFSQPPQYNETVDGVSMTVVDYQTFIYPTRSGELSIGPIHIDATLLYRTQRSNPLSGNAFFNDDFFNGMFDSYQERPITVNAQALKINVLPLPQEGRPENFTGAVGKIEFAAAISPMEVRAGDPITLRMRLTGEANYKSLHLPVFNDPRFKTYDPVIKDADNSRLQEQVIIPSGPEVKQVPAVEFNYFDPQAGQYRVITQGPFDIKVSPLSKDQEFKAVGFADLSKPAQAKAAVPVDYVKKYLIGPVKGLIALARTWKFWLGVFLFAALGAALSWWERFREKLRRDTDFARRHRAFKTAKEGIKQAQGLLEQGGAKDFYSCLIKTLNNFLADKMGRGAAGIEINVLEVVLRGKGVGEEVIDALRKIYAGADLVQFASGQIDPARMKEDLGRVSALIALLEKKL